MGRLKRCLGLASCANTFISTVCSCELFLFKSGRLTGCPALCMGHRTTRTLQLATGSAESQSRVSCAVPLRQVDMANKLRSAEIQIVAISN